MADVEKQQNGGGTTSATAAHPLPTADETRKGSAAHAQGHAPVGADAAAGPYTLGASNVQQHFYQGGLPLRTLANPAPLGLFSFASTTLILSLINVQTQGVREPNVVVGMSLAVGGLCQLLAGMWEFAAGNTFGATAFTSYGGFWLSYSAIQIPDSGIVAAYNGDAEMLAHALGLYLCSWFVFTFLMLIASLRTNTGLILLFFFLTMTFMLLMVAEFYQNTDITKAGGALGIFTAWIAYYCACANLWTRESSFITLPLLPIKRD